MLKTRAASYSGGLAAQVMYTNVVSSAFDGVIVIVIVIVIIVVIIETLSITIGSL